MYCSPNPRAKTTAMPVTLTPFFCATQNTFNGSISVSTERIYDMLSTAFMPFPAVISQTHSRVMEKRQFQVMIILNNATQHLKKVFGLIG